MKTNEHHIVGGCYYDTGAGVALIYGFMGDRIMYRYDDHREHQSCTHAEASKWKKLDIRDFPNARDPKLPYDFDLHYDIKYLSQLKMELNGELNWCNDHKHLHELIKLHNIII